MDIGYSKTIKRQSAIISIGLPYKIVSDSFALISYEGDNIKFFQIVVQQTSDRYFVLNHLKEALPGNICKRNSKYLFHQNNNFDVVKICKGDVGITVALGAILYEIGTHTALLKSVIAQVVTVADIIGGDF